MTTPPMESFWGTLKNELVHHQRYETREQAQQEITAYIEVFYNRHGIPGSGISRPRRLPSSGPVNSQQREAVIHGVHY